MKNIKVVIGSNFGDEGKGLMTDYFANQAKMNNEKCIVICHNGGSQRGHTVVTPDGKRHVFSHFGSGTFAGADTFLSEHFIVNPIMFMKEYKILQSKLNKPIKPIKIDHECDISLPYDMIINQIVENRRGENKHGSCGMGIYETICRNHGCVYDFPFNNSFILSFLLEFKTNIYRFSRMLDEEKSDFLKQVRDEYVKERLNYYNITDLTESENKLINNDNLIYNYIDDFNQMMNCCELTYFNKVYDEYDNIIFEGGQGLLLDQENKDYFPNLTPSYTGSTNPHFMLYDGMKWLKIFNGVFSNCDLKNILTKVEVCYVTRTYMTRHGAGKFPTECSKSEISKNIHDDTNVPNQYQDTLRYGYLDYDDLLKRCIDDFNIWEDFTDFPVSFSLAITHMDDIFIDERVTDDVIFEVKTTNEKLIPMTEVLTNALNENLSEGWSNKKEIFNTLYVSYGKTKNDIIEHRV